MQSLLLTDVRIVLPDRLLDGSVLLDNGKIASIIPNTDPPVNAADRRELKGLTLFPGFIDVHIHGASGVDAMGASAEDLRMVARFLATKGVTGWLPTLVPATQESYQASISSAEQLISEQQTSPTPDSARVLGIHYEGPFVNEAQCGALHVEHFRFFRHHSELSTLPLLRATGPRMMMTLAPEIEGGVDLTRALCRQGWVVAMGHTRANTGILDQAFDAGARHMTHFMNAMSPMHHRNPGPIAWGLSRDDVTCDVIADGIHLDPFMLRLLLKLKGSRNLMLISDAIAAAGKGDGDYNLWGETITVKNGRTSNAAGSIAGSVITMLDAVRMMRSLNASDVELAQMASSNPARLLRLDHEIGSVEEGKRADLVALDDRGEVRLTIVGGKIVFEG